MSYILYFFLILCTDQVKSKVLVLLSISSLVKMAVVGVDVVHHPEVS